ncbi:MAG: phosphoglycolate phosphatase [Rhodoferax sp.]|nr:phosphoglycolate phosphatase [Rhodoferax sp.]
MHPHHSKIDAAIIDLDGTLIDTLGDFAVALNLMLGDLAGPGAAPARVDHAMVERWVGKGSEHLIHCVLNHVVVHDGYEQSAMNSEAILARARDSYQRHYGVINGRYATVFPGARDGLRALRRRGLPLACLTNKPTAFARTLLQAKGLDGFFSQVFGGDAFERKKPDPLPLRKTCEALGTAPARTLMIGDSSNDAQAARAAGCPVVLVTYGYNHGEPVRAVDADGFVDSLAELARVGGV